MRITNGSSVMSYDIGDLVLTESLSLDLAKLESSLLSVDLVWLELSLNVVKHSEVLSSLLDGNDVHEANREFMISPGLVVDFNHAFFVFHDLQDFLSR